MCSVALPPTLLLLLLLLPIINGSDATLPAPLASTGRSELRRGARTAVETMGASSSSDDKMMRGWRRGGCGARVGGGNDAGGGGKEKPPVGRSID